MFTKRLTGSPEPWVRVAEFSAEPDEVVATTRDVVDEVAARYVGCVVRVVRRKQVFDWYVPVAGPRVRVPLAREFWIGSSTPTRVIGGADWITAWWESTDAAGMMHALARLDRRTAVGVLCGVALSLLPTLRARRRPTYDVENIEVIETVLRAIAEKLRDPKSDLRPSAELPAVRSPVDTSAMVAVAADLEFAAASLGSTWQVWSSTSFFPKTLADRLEFAAAPQVPPFDLPAAMRAQMPMERLLALFAPMMRRAREP